MDDYEFILSDRLAVIRDTIGKYGEDRFYLSFSGGRDSCVLSRLLDMALPKNRIPRVFIDTGIEYKAIREFVLSKAKEDDRFIIVKPTKAIIPMLKQCGYPFKSKEHSLKIGQWQKGHRTKSIERYARGGEFGCPKSLLYQLEPSFNIRLSNQCCYQLKKNPIRKWEKENGRPCAILGIKSGEGGERANHKGCAVFGKGGSLIHFKPLNPVTEEWENEFLERERVTLCKLYYPPYNFKRTGCKGCPYALDLERQLEIMQLYMPDERAQCEMIWKPVYDEYRRIGYRLKKEEQLRLF